MPKTDSRIDLHWFLPTSGDGRSVTDFFPDTSEHSVSRPRAADIDYLRQIAQAPRTGSASSAC